MKIDVAFTGLVDRSKVVVKIGISEVSKLDKRFNRHGPGAKFEDVAQCPVGVRDTEKQVGMLHFRACR